MSIVVANDFIYFLYLVSCCFFVAGSTMEEQENNMIEVTVKTLDSQSRSYTVRAQVSSLLFLFPKSVSWKGVKSSRLYCHSSHHRER